MTNSATDMVHIKLRRCEIGQKRSCIDHFDVMDCSSAFAFCERELTQPYLALGVYLTAVLIDEDS